MILPLQTFVLEMIARGESVADMARRLCAEAERLAPDCLCSILTIDDRGALWTLAAPSLPPDYCALVDGTAIGPEVGSCGRAASIREPVAVTDIATDPLWTDFRDAALAEGLAACWSSPIIGKDGRAIGTFAFYFRTRRGPSRIEREIVASCLELCAIAIERSQSETAIRRLAYIDSLTGLGNRASFNDAVEKLAGPKPSPFALLLIDVDRLKFVNDTFGHESGDDLLREVGRRIGAAIEGAAAFRIGGDEFAVILQGARAAARIDDAARRILDAMGPPASCGGQTLQLTVTIGGARSTRAGESVATIRQRADFALYEAKESRRAGFVRFTEGMRTKIAERFHVIRRVGAALDDGRIEPHYQPVVRLDTREIIGLEALCRMRGRNGQVIPAAAFAKAMNDDGMARRITDRMLARIAADMRSWLDADVPLQHVGVNFAAGDFRRGDLAKVVSDRFGERNVPLKHVILEVTESVYMDEREQSIAKAIASLRRKGLLVALDDFGTGYASLTHLLTFPVDIIKIDRSFVSRLGDGAAGDAIVEGLIGIAHRLGMRIVAEGVETERHVELLRAAGARLGQGYLFGRPADMRVTTKRLLRYGQRKTPGPQDVKSAA